MESLSGLLPDFDYKTASIVTEASSLFLLLLASYFFLSLIRRSLVLFKYVIIITAILAIIGLADEHHRSIRTPAGARGVQWWTNRGNSPVQSTTAKEWESAASHAMEWIERRMDETISPPSSGRTVPFRSKRSKMGTKWSKARKVMIASTAYAGRGFGTVVALIARYLG